MGPDVPFAAGWTAPPELTGPLPRRTRMSASAIAPIAGALLILLVTAAVVPRIHGIMAAQTAWTQPLRREGRDTIGEVKELRHRPGGEYIVRYTFTANGAVFTGESSAPENIWNGIRKAAPLPIRSLPSNPVINHPAAWEQSAGATRFLFVLLLLPISGGILILTRLFRQRRLVAEGVPTPGVVTRCYSVGRGSPAVAYQFRTQEGRVAQGTGRLCSGVGTTICVLYLADNPRRNLPYLGSWYRAVQ